MNNQRIINFVLLLMVTSTCLNADECTLKETSPDVICFCDRFDDGSPGWEYSCLEASSFESLFKVTYRRDHFVQFTCDKQEPFYQSIFHQMQVGEIKVFAFENCSLPNSSYSEIIPYRHQYPIEKITIKAKRDNDLFTAELFGNISETLQHLTLNDNKINVLPESFLKNFTQLKNLFLSDNRLRTLPEGIFSEVTTLVTLDISSNLLENLPEKLFQNLTSLEALYLYRNKLKSLPEGIFKTLSKLKALDLADNNLMLLQDDIFAGLSSLNHIRLRANWLMTLSKDLFQSSPNLKAIDLSLNRFMEPLSENLFFGLTQLENVSITNCNLTEIFENFFSYCPNLIHLHLERNSLTSLPKNIFRNNSLLKDIHLNFNRLNDLHPDLLPNQTHLEKFSAFKNNLSVIPDGLFQSARKIKSLVLGGNQIQNAGESIFRYLPELETLDLHDNNISYFKLDYNGFIKSIDLSHNNLSKMPVIEWTRHLRLELVNLENNKITYLQIPVLFATNAREPYLKFGNNSIKTVNAENVSLNDYLINDNLSGKDLSNYVETRIDLSSNPFLCDCQIFKFYKYIKQSEKLPKKSIRLDVPYDLTCKEPQNLEGKRMMLLSPNQFTCELPKQCSHPCHCYTRAQDNANIVNCSYHKLSDLPSLIPNNTKVLLFQENILVNMSAFNSDMWQNLTDLFLDRNQINSLDYWNIPVNLTNISLNGNNISHLPSSIMNFISSSQEFAISLSDNPFDCNCSATNFKKWLAQHYQFVKDVKNIMCANRVKVNGTLVRLPVLTTPDDILCPLDDWPYKLHLISITILCVVLALLLFVVSVLYYRNKQTVIAYVYIHLHHVFTCFFNEEEMDEDKVFDAFVSYSSSDRDVVLMLIDELEQKEPRFQLCIHERNWIPGNPISWNIFNSVHNSKRTILVISKEFLQSMWFQVEFHAAFYQMLEDKIDRLIIIVKGELPPKDTLDKNLQYLLTTKTYLIWEEKWFWEKLKYAMPHKRHQLLPNDVLALKDRPASEKIRPVDNQIAVLSSQKNGKIQAMEPIQNHTNSTLNLIKKDSSTKSNR
ncbi:protein toll [Trichonephila clavipes]|nr:protein toll [Trichonephila clavipes]